MVEASTPPTTPRQGSSVACAAADAARIAAVSAVVTCNYHNLDQASVDHCKLGSKYYKHKHDRYNSSTRT
jgi:hypothetical protein